MIEKQLYKTTLLSEEQIREIALTANRMSSETELAERYDVPRTLVHSAITSLRKAGVNIPFPNRGHRFGRIAAELRRTNPELFKK